MDLRFTELHIIGVVKDFNWESLHNEVGALCLQLGGSQGLASFRYKGSETASVIAALEKNWRVLSPEQPFSYRMLDESFSRMYESEQRPIPNTPRSLSGIFVFKNKF